MLVQFQSLALPRSSGSLARQLRIFNLVVESLERLLHGGNAFLELVALLEEQGLTAPMVLSPCWNRATYSMSASICRPAARIHLIKLDPAARGLVVITDAAFGARYRRDQPMRS